MISNPYKLIRIEIEYCQLGILHSSCPLKGGKKENKKGKKMKAERKNISHVTQLAWFSCLPKMGLISSFPLKSCNQQKKKKNTLKLGRLFLIYWSLLNGIRNVCCYNRHLPFWGYFAHVLVLNSLNAMSSFSHF